jgi:hypothetical protein
MRSLGSGHYGSALLDTLVRETARQPLPPVDWDEVEQRLFAQIDPQPKSRVVTRSAAPRRRAASVFSVAVAAAAAVAVVRLAPRDSVRVPQPTTSHRVLEANFDSPGTGTLSGPLLPGDVAEAATAPIRYESRGSLSFTLAPASRVEVVTPETAPGSTSVDGASKNTGMTIALVSGSVHAEVVPRPAGEVFAVEVGKTRIAAHGTSFTVSRRDDRVLVEVAHGAVAVGPAGHPGSTHGWLLVGPDRAWFSIDGAREASWSDEAPVAGVEPSPPSAEVSSAARSASAQENTTSGVAAAEQGALQEMRRDPLAHAGRSRSSSRSFGERDGMSATEGAEKQKAATAVILSRLNACYERQVASLGVRFSIRSSLTLTIAPNGTVREGVFDPPLSPTLMACARDAIGAVRFPQEGSTVVLRVPVELSPAP